MENQTNLLVCGVPRLAFSLSVAATFKPWDRIGRGQAGQTCGRRNGFWTCETVVVAGATGGVGRLVVKRLLDQSKSFQSQEKGFEASAVHEKDNMAQETGIGGTGLNVTRVIALVRDVDQAREALPVANDALQIVGLNEDTGQSDEEARGRLRGVLSRALAGAAGMVICTGTTAFPTRSWRGGNTPKAVDDEFVGELVNSVDGTTIRRVVLVSSIGTSLERRRSFPFIILNIFGVLFSKARGEEHVKEAARRLGFAYSVLHTGRLIGEPHSNIGVLKLAPDPHWSEILVAKGDTLKGDLSRSAAADAAVATATWHTRSNFEFSIVHTEGCSPDNGRWNELLRSVEMPRR